MSDPKKRIYTFVNVDNYIVENNLEESSYKHDFLKFYENYIFKFNLTDEKHGHWISGMEGVLKEIAYSEKDKYTHVTSMQLEPLFKDDTTGDSMVTMVGGKERQPYKII